MISLIQTGEYDGVSASGNASVRMMAPGDVAPIDPDLIPNYADVAGGDQGQGLQLAGRPAVRRPARPRAELPACCRTADIPEDTDSWAVHLGGRPAREDYKGKISIYDDSIFIADAALYLKATQPDLGIENPYQLTEEQFDAAVDLLKKQAPNVGEYWPGDVAKQIQSFTNGDSVVGTTWPYQYIQLTGDERPCARRSSPRRARPAGRTRG